MEDTRTSEARDVLLTILSLIVFTHAWRNTYVAVPAVSWT